MKTYKRTYKEYIDYMKDIWLGKNVIFEGEEFKVIDIDYNGMLLINKPAEYTDTTAVGECMVEII